MNLICFNVFDMKLLYAIVVVMVKQKKKMEIFKVYLVSEMNKTDLI